MEHKSRIELGWDLFVDIGFPWKYIGHNLETEILREDRQDVGVDYRISGSKCSVNQGGLPDTTLQGQAAINDLNYNQWEAHIAYHQNTESTFEAIHLCQIRNKSSYGNELSSPRTDADNLIRGWNKLTLLRRVRS
jgi:hypothetical protein